MGGVVDMIFGNTKTALDPEPTEQPVAPVSDDKKLKRANERRLASTQAATGVEGTQLSKTSTLG